MKLLLLLLSLLEALALAEKCQCPQVRCPTDDPEELRNCVNDREYKCSKRCPSYVPTYLPHASSPLATIPLPTTTSSPSHCTCDQVFCIMIWPQSCHCANNNAKACFEKCGGKPPVPKVCETPTTMSTRYTSLKNPVLVKKPISTNKSVSIKIPTSAKYTTTISLPPKPKHTNPPCGGGRALNLRCQPISTNKSVSTKIPTSAKYTTTISLPPKPKHTNPPCGGGRALNLRCQPNQLCIKDPFKSGCGPECDGLGICVEDKMCGGFAGRACSEKGMVCVDDPRDACSAEDGGADCAGLCVWGSGA